MFLVLLQAVYVLTINFNLEFS